ncbi:LOW QUALITY PROTEIN: transmembrane protein 242-like [Tachypleus tridentatus]|uniref:LOW QUALITY PROTEIN: transmembrane protein 242-like n=1 Tax=Tachypleus tridentatus TaxID=6853 RepID=UPI003FD5537D
MNTSTILECCIFCYGKGKMESNKKKEKILGGAFLAGVAGASLVFGFGMTLAMAKRKDPTFFTKGLVGSKEVPESGGSLAVRALGWGTLYAVCGFGLFCFGVWKSLGVQNLKEFRQKMGEMLPQIPKKEPQGRTEFENLRELLNYVIEESEKGKRS